MVSSMDVLRAARNSASVRLRGTSSGRSMLEMWMPRRRRCSAASRTRPIT